MAHRKNTGNLSIFAITWPSYNNLELSGTRQSENGKLRIRIALGNEAETRSDWETARKMLVEARRVSFFAFSLGPLRMGIRLISDWETPRKNFV